MLLYTTEPLPFSRFLYSMLYIIYTLVIKMLLILIVKINSKSLCGQKIVHFFQKCLIEQLSTHATLVCECFVVARKKWVDWRWGMGCTRSSTNCLMEFCVSFIIKQLLSVIDLRRGVSQLCGIRKPNCSEVVHYSTGILTWRLTRACQFLSGGLGIATFSHLPFLIIRSHVYTLTQKWFMLGHYQKKLHAH